MRTDAAWNLQAHERLKEMKTPPSHFEISARLLYQEAEARGIDCTFLGDERTIFMEKDGITWYTRGSRSSIQSSVGLSIADDKLVTKRICHHFGLPTSRFVHVASHAQLDKLESLTFPVVMKPTNLKHGEGVVVGIPTIAAAARYFERLGRSALFEEMLQGEEYRVVCVDFEFVAAAMRHPAFVTADGSHTIAQLIEQKNQQPGRGKGHLSSLTTIEVDELVLELLQEQHYTLESIPPAETKVALRRTGNLSTGGEAWDFTDDVCESNRALFARIARCCDLNVIGIDIMCSSLQTPIEDQKGAGIIEVNASPGLRMHHFPSQGKPRNVAARIIEMTLRKLQAHPHPPITPPSTT